jgi:predicted amidophosphoribosyltransferase
VPTTVLLGSFQIGQMNELHALIRAARGGTPAAANAVLGAVAASTEHAWPEVNAALVLPVPGHMPGGSSPLIEAAATIFAQRRAWELDLAALTRSRPSPEGKLGGARDPASESLTLSVAARRSARRDDAEVIVLFDDVVRSGATLLACADAVRRLGDTRPIVAIAIGRASDAD